jgi:hypothetical protein
VTAPAGRAPNRRVRSRPKRGRRVGRWALRLLVTLLAFVLGLAVGRALEDNPEPGGERTYVRTLKPLPVVPARETVTVTVKTR